MLVKKTILKMEFGYQQMLVIHGIILRQLKN